MQPGRVRWPGTPENHDFCTIWPLPNVGTSVFHKGHRREDTDDDSNDTHVDGPIFIPPACPLMSELVCFWVAKSGSGFLKAPFSCHPPVLALQGWYSL